MGLKTPRPRRLSPLLPGISPVPSPLNLTSEDLDKITARKGYAIIGGSKLKPIASAFGSNAARAEARGEGTPSDVERSTRHEPVPAERVALNYSGRVRVRIKFYRRRLADYSRANCEKFVIDAARYAGLLLDDSEAHMELIDEGQTKVESVDQERIEMTFEYEDVDLTNLWKTHPRQDGR